MSKYTTNAPGAQKWSPELINFRLDVDYIKEYKQLPETSPNGNMGATLAEYAVDLHDAFTAGGIDCYNKALAALIASEPSMMFALSAPLPTKEIEDPAYIKAEDGSRSFRKMTVTDVWNLPDIDWLVSGILQRSTTTLVVGTGNVGKTFVWLDVCMNIAYGMRWLNHRTRQGTVLYIYAEGSSGLKQRIKAWLIDHGKATQEKITDPTDKIAFIPRPVHLLRERQELINTIEIAIKEQGSAPEEIVIDTFSMCAGGVDENSNSQVAEYLETATYIKLQYGCHVTIIHHQNKAGGFRGASALRDNVDTMITLDRDDKEGPIKVECDKQRDAEIFPPFYLQLKTVMLGINPYTNESITSCVVEEAHKETNIGKGALTEKQAKMVELLEVHGSLTSGNWQKQCEAIGISRDSFNYTIKGLEKDGVIVKTEYMSGKQKRVNYSLAEARNEAG